MDSILKYCFYATMFAFDPDLHTSDKTFSFLMMIIIIL